METNKNKHIEREVRWIIKNWNIISDKYKSNLKPNQYRANVKNLNVEEHFVVLLLDRQKPSVIADYSFDEERIGITREGKIVWGFDSGCSCPIPWDDNFPDCYNVSKSWKEFEVNLNQFDKEVIEECLKKIQEVKQEAMQSETRHSSQA